MTLKLNSEGEVLRDGAEIDVGFDDVYVSVCHKHWQRGISKV